MSVPSLVAAGRRMVARTLLDRVVRQKEVAVADGQGGSISTWVDIGGLVPVRFGMLNEADSAGRNLRAFAGQLEGVAGSVLQVPLAYDLPESSRVRNVADGRTWQIIGELTAPSATATVRRFVIREV